MELQVPKTGYTLAGATVDAKERGRLKWLGIWLRLVVMSRKNKETVTCNTEHLFLYLLFLHFYLRGPSYFSFISSAISAVGEVTSLEFVVQWCSGSGGGTQPANSDRFWDIIGLYTPSEGVSMCIPRGAMAHGSQKKRWRMVKVWINKLHILICPH